MATLGYFWTTIFLINIVIKITFTTPLYTSQYFTNGNARNIRNLPCVSLRTGETGVCMFAFNCVKANGTHLGTCLDRFYFGSCCKITDESTDNYHQDNTIDDTSSLSSFITTGKPFESNDIPDYKIKTKPEHSPNLLVTKIPMTTVASDTTRIITTTTTQSSIGLSTFQSVQSSLASSTVMKTTAANTQSYTTASHRVSPTTESSVKRPTTIISSKPTLNSTSTINRNPPATRFPPRNTSTTTTTQLPLTTVKTTTAATTKATTKPKLTTTTTTTSTSTERPISVVTKRPVTSTSTKKPSAATKRPQATLKPLVTSRPSGETIATTRSPSTSITNPTKSSTPASTVLITKKPAQASSSTNKVPVTTTTTTTTTTRPTTRKSTTVARPSVTTSKPRPSSHPTKTSSIISTKPTIRPASRPTVDSTDKTRPTLTSLRPTTKPKPTGKPAGKPTGKPTKPFKPVKPIQNITVETAVNKLSNITHTTRITTEPTNVITTIMMTNKPTTISTMTTTTPTTRITTTTTKATTTTTTTTNKPTTMTNEILQSTATPGIITWSSNSDDLITESPVTSSTQSSSAATITTTHLQDDATDTDWSPITTPDGWIMIQSPSTKKPGNIDESVTELKPTKLPFTSAEPLTSESITQRTTSTLKPTVPTVVSSSIADTSSIPLVVTTTPVSSPIMPTDRINMSDYKQVCGRRIFPESRIVGGERSAFGKWPWQISLRQWRTSAFLHKCGAALLNENWAITAAHCVENVPPSDLLLRMGEHDLAHEDEPYGFQERRVQIVASHPQFDPRTFEYDLALLRFYEPLLPFQPNLLPICLPDDDEEYVDRTAYVTGWGRLYEDGPLPSVLQEVSVPVINNTVCESMYRNAGYIEHIPHIFICAGWRKGGFDSCEGDSGGPLVIQRPRDKRWILAGVISWGIGCAEPNQPGVYTRISEFREWINQILQF